MPDFHEIAELAVRCAGAVLLDLAGRVAVQEKGPADLVTEADLASQQVVRRTVLEAFPGHEFLGEEDPPAARRPAEGYRWIVDPLDGTTNYVHGVPHYCVALALEHRGELQVAAIYDPVLDECFTARRGGGAQLNGKPIRASGVERLEDALVAVGFPAEVPGDGPDIALFLQAVVRCQAIRRMGSAALNLAYVAAGRLDASWGCATKLWDVAAGTLLVREAGGAVTSLASDVYQLGEAPILSAANLEVLQRLVALAARVGLRAAPGALG